MQRNSVKIITGGRPVNGSARIAGPAMECPLMRRSYDPNLVRLELGVLHEHGLGVTRLFFCWPDFMPGHDQAGRGRVVTFTSGRDFGPLPQGARLAFRAAGSRAQAQLPAGPAGRHPR